MIPYNIGIKQTQKIKNLKKINYFLLKQEKKKNKNLLFLKRQKINSITKYQLKITHLKSVNTKNLKKRFPDTKKPLHISNMSSNSLIASWQWPTRGKIIRYFCSSYKGNKGIDIAGNKGQAIKAASDGRVVYVGNALRGYGNLIIIKHSNSYLSAYAHNDKMLVQKKQEVKAGQRIATMGNTGTNSTRLYFEIRYRGKSVNPIKYLPRIN